MILSSSAWHQRSSAGLHYSPNLPVRTRGENTNAIRGGRGEGTTNDFASSAHPPAARLGRATLAACSKHRLADQANVLRSAALAGQSKVPPNAPVATWLWRRCFFAHSIMVVGIESGWRFCTTLRRIVRLKRESARRNINLMRKRPFAVADCLLAQECTLPNQQLGWCW